MASLNKNPMYYISIIIRKILYMILSLYALYLSFKCNKGFDFGSVVVAILFSPIYIVYRMAIPCK